MQKSQRVKDKPRLIKLSHGGTIDADKFIARLAQEPGGQIVIGQQKAKERDHTKRRSLDYWLRQFGVCRDTKQADKAVIDQLEETSLFIRKIGVKCPKTHRPCKGLEFTPNGRKRAGKLNFRIAIATKGER